MTAEEIAAVKDRLKVKYHRPTPVRVTAHSDGRVVVKPAAPVKPAPAKETLPEGQYSCGHAVHMAAYKARLCPECQDKNNKRKEEKFREKRAKKKSKVFQLLTDRLPDGAKFTASYDSEKVEWSGTLDLIDSIGEKQHHEAVAVSVMKLLFQLDYLYRGVLLSRLPPKKSQPSESSDG